MLPDTAHRILEGAVLDDQTGCLISTLTPSKKRPLVWIPPNNQVVAYRVVMAVELGRPILPEEDVHHRCEVKRCVNPPHLEVELHLDHSALHAEQQRQKVCSVHGTPYDRRDKRTGWGICRACAREGTRRYRAKIRAQ